MKAKEASWRTCEWALCWECRKARFLAKSSSIGHLGVQRLAVALWG